MGSMDFDFGSLGKSNFNLGQGPVVETPTEGIGLELPGEAKVNELSGETQMKFQNDIRASNQNNYFTAMIHKYPDGNFIFYLKPEQIQKSAKERIFREMVQGRIDYTLFGQYYNDSKFLGNLLIAAQDELINNTTIRNALVFYNTNFPGDQNTVYLCSKYESLVYVFSVLFEKFNIVKTTSNVGCLADIQYLLSQHRNVLQ